MKTIGAARHYDTLDVWYRALWGDHLHHGIWHPETPDRAEANANLLRAVAQAAGLRPGMRVCDVGCGYGGPARWLAGHFEVEVTGVTISPVQYEAAKRRTRDPRVRYLLGDWLGSGLPEGEFDAVVAIESVFHFTEPRAACREMIRVVKPGHRIVIAGWIIGDLVPAWARWLLIEPIRAAGEMPGLADEWTCRRRFEEEGAEAVSMTRLGMLVEQSWSDAMGRALRGLLRNPVLRWEALRHPVQTLRLAVSSLRIWTAYRWGFLDYLILAVERNR
ncbi:methyltransferase domain-containing protein [Luteolibacter sp. LG18]|uniref:SAM-dependent methyltransferase n=1 Tax=Luteolibacter sp. LG18 TaxID=2819286 RepID=UPI002B2AD2A7|nr:delta(24)-sterol C-methyltransferase [Luteolibacter sp. LG18]